MEEISMSKKRFIDSIRVSDPCTEDWDEMVGNEKVRLCTHCAREVNDISKLRRKDAKLLLRRSSGRICVRYREDPQTGKKVFLDSLFQITRRSGIAAGALGASIALSNAAYSQGKPSVPAVEIVTQKPADSNAASISGYVSDPNGAVIPFAFVSLVGEHGEYHTATANAEGFYEFKDLSPGNYRIKFEAGGFTANEQFTSISESEAVRRDGRLELTQVAEVVEVRSNGDFDGGGFVGIVDIIKTRNPLVQAVFNEDFDEIKARIAMRAKVNVKDKAYDGITPLHAAVETGNIEIVKFLLAHGAKTNIRDYQKRTPLMMMDSDSTPELFQLLVSYGAKTNLVDKEGNTILHHFAGFDNPEIVRMLVANGIDLNSINKDGETALIVAADGGASENVKALLEAGADPNIRGRGAKTAWDSAYDEAIKSLLESYGAVAKVE